jgi:hypothetical protein
VAAKRDLLQIVEVAYDLEASDQAWLEELAKSVQPHLDAGFGVAAFEYYRPEGALPQIVHRCHLGIPEPLAMLYPRIFDTMDPEIRQRPFRLGPCVALTGVQ